MSGLTFDQLRVDTNPGLEGTLVGNTEGPIRVKVGAGLTRDANGILVNGSQASMKTPCRARTTGNIADLAAGAPLTVDGVTLASGDRVLVGDQTTVSQDGIYVVVTAGSGSNGSWSRSADAPTGGEAAGWYIQVLEGTTQGDRLYRVDADAGAATIGTDGWTLVEFGGATSSTLAGNGLVANGAAIDINLEASNPSLQISGDELGIKFTTAGGLQKSANGTEIKLDTGGASGLALSVNGLAIDSDTETGGNIQGVNLTANGVGLDVNAIAGFGLAADGSANLAVNGAASTFKEPCRVKTNANITLSGGAPNTVDSVSLSVGNRILVADQTTTSEDGIYEVQTLGTGSNGTWVRTADAPIGGEAAGWFIQVLEGSLENLYRVDANLGGATIGTDGWSLSTFSGGASRTAGAGLVDGPGDDLDVNTGDGIAIDTDRVVAQVATAVGAQQYGGLVRNRNATGASTGTANAGYLAVQTDNSTLGVNASNQVSVQAAGITETQLNTSVAGNGLTGGGGTALAVGAGAGISVAANSVAIDTTGSTAVNFQSGGYTGQWSYSPDQLQIIGTPDSANDSVNKSYVDNLISGVTWLEPVTCLCLVGNATVATLNGLGNPGAVSDVYVVTDSGTLTLGSLSVAAGDVVQWDNGNTQWIKIATNVGGFPPNGFRIALNGGTALISPYTDGVDDGKIAEFDGTSLTGALTSPSNGNAVLVVAWPGAPSPPVLVNQAYVFNGTVPTGTWTQFSGAGGLNAGTGLSISGNTINFTSADTSLTVNANDAQVNVGLGLAVSSGVNIDLDTTKRSAAGDSDASNNPLYLDSTNGINVKVDASTIDLDSGNANRLYVPNAGITETQLNTSVAGNGLTGGGGSALAVGAGNGLSVAASSVAVASDSTGGANLASVIDVNANGVAIRVDDTTIEDDGNGGTAQLRIKDLGVSTAKLAANAVTLAKTDIRFREEQIAASSFTNTNPSTADLAVAVLIGTQPDFYQECYRNGLADMTNVGNAGTPSGATQFKIDNTGAGSVGRVTIGANISASGNTYRIRYLSTAT
jgi:hypothetical protein